jgi:uncharacterized protein YcbX
MAKAGDEIGTVAEIWRYPVQSMGGETLEAADIAGNGIVGDRLYGVVDPEAGMVVSSAQGRRKWRDIVTLVGALPGRTGKGRPAAAGRDPAA